MGRSCIFDGEPEGNDESHQSPEAAVTVAAGSRVSGLYSFLSAIPWPVAAQASAVKYSAACIPSLSAGTIQQRKRYRSRHYGA